MMMRKLKRRREGGKKRIIGREPTSQYLSVSLVVNTG